MDPIYRRLDFAPAAVAQLAQYEAEAAIRERYGLAYSFDDDPPPELAGVIAEELLVALVRSRSLVVDEGGG